MHGAVCWRSAGADAPNSEFRRVVSFNLCADQLVLALADPSQIAGFAVCRRSGLVGHGRQGTCFPQARLAPESTIALQPDSISSDPIDRSMTRRMLISQGLRVVEVGFVSDLEFCAQADPRDGRIARAKRTGRQAARRSGARRARLAAVSRKGGETALVVERGGYTQGPSSLAATLLSETGRSRRPARPRAMAVSFRWRNFWC